MAKVSITTLANLDNPVSAVAEINANFVAIQTAIEKQLSRDGTSPNSMSANMDMNGYRIINLPAPLASTDAARHGDLQGYVDDAEAAQAAAEAAQALAETAQGNAELAETNAETALTSAEAVLSSLNAKWLGVDTSDPTLDDSGTPVATGAFYYNSSLGVFRVLSSGVWYSVPSATLAGLSDVDVSSVANGQGVAWNSTTEKFEPVSLTGARAVSTFLPYDSIPPATNYASLDIRNGHPVLDFDTTTEEAAVFTSAMAETYAGGDLKITLFCSATSATTGTIGWLVAVERIDASSLDIDADDFATAVTITAQTVPGTSGQILAMTATLDAPTETDGVLAGEAFRLKVSRDVTNDTAAGDAELLLVKLEEI
jgi:hypothetical protein